MNIFPLQDHWVVCNLAVSCRPPACPEQVCPFLLLETLSRRLTLDNKSKHLHFGPVSSSVFLFRSTVFPAVVRFKLLWSLRAHVFVILWFLDSSVDLLIFSLYNDGLQTVISLIFMDSVNPQWTFTYFGLTCHVLSSLMSQYNWDSEKNKHVAVLWNNKRQWVTVSVNESSLRKVHV